MTRTIALCSMLLAGCGGDTGDAASASQAIDSSQASGDESALAIVATDGTDTATTASEAAARAAATAGNRWQPSSCVTATVDNVTVTYVLADCSGPRGLEHVTGTLVASYSQSSSGVGVHLTAVDLAVDATTLSIDSNAAVTLSGTQKEVDVQTSVSGTGALGNSFMRSGAYVTDFDTSSDCVAVNGMWSTAATSGKTWSTSVTGWQRCGAGHCPTGTITHARPNDVTITVALDGTSVAKWSSSRGATGTILLACTP